MMAKSYNSSNCLLGNDFGLQYHYNRPTLLGDWRKDPNINGIRDLVRNRIAQILVTEGNYRWKLLGQDFVNFLDNQLFSTAGTKEEYINLDTLRNQLESFLIMQNGDVNCSQQVSNYSMPNLMAMQTLDLTKRQSYLNSDVSQYNPMVAGKSDQLSFRKGLLNNDYEPAVTSMYNASPVGSKQIASEMVCSPEMNSNITTCSSVDGIPEIGTIDGRPAFAQGDYPYCFEASYKDNLQQQYFDHGNLNPLKFGNLGNGQNLQPMALSEFNESLEYSNSFLQILAHSPRIISGLSGILPSSRMNGGMISTVENLLESKSPVLEQNNQQPFQPYGKLNNALEVKAPSCFTDQKKFCSQMPGQLFSMQSKLPSEQSHGDHVASESSAPFFTSKATTRMENSNNRSQFFMREIILLSYVKYMKSVGPMENSLDSFFEHFHSTACQNHSCLCEQIRPAVSHFVDCRFADCLICSPARTLYYTEIQNVKDVKNSLKRNFNDTDSSGYGSCISGDMLLPKHQKMGKPLYHFPSGNEIASAVVPFIVQPGDPQGLPPLHQLPGSPASINSELVELNNELLMNSMKNPASSAQTRNGTADNCPRLIFESVSASFKDVFAGCGSGELDSRNSGEMDSRSSGEIVDTLKGHCNQLMVSSMAIVSKEMGPTSKEEALQGISKTDLAEPAIEDALNATRIENKEEMKTDAPQIRDVSLINFFTAEQIKGHISSLGQIIPNIGDKVINHAEENCMMPCQLCTEGKRWFAPMPIYCSCCGARIKRGVIYYVTSDEDGMRPCFCTSCYKVSRGGRITFYGISIPKVKLHKKKNDEATDEPWVQCDKCKRWQHQICALYNKKRDMEGKAEYICPKCCLEELKSMEPVPSSKAGVFGAKDLPGTILSDFIEERLFERLKQEKQERAKGIGMNLDKVPEAEDLVVRVVLSVNKQLKVKEKFLEIFHGENYPTEFLYRSKVILLFQKIEGVDVCLFGFYVQEFGSECSYPNQRCVYISYLDSVKYFRPERETSTGEALRTFVYHEILIGYLEYCKKRGFATCYLWACPPIKGEDYILYCHPEIQKTPKSDKLRQWYHSMLKKASKENIVVGYTNLYDHYFVSTGQSCSKITAARLPYFDGCYWSDSAENILKNIEQQTGEYAGRKMKKVMTKRTLKAMGHTNPSGDATKDILLMQKLGQAIFPAKEDFLVVHLQVVCMHCHETILSGSRWSCSQCKNFQLCERCHDAEKSLNGGASHTLNSKEKHPLSKVAVNGIPSDTEDRDAILENWLFENRHTFLGFCQKNYYQFDTLRRAKHSSMMILHHLHNPTVPLTGTTCKICHQDADTKDGDVCAACYHKKDSSLHIYKLNQCSPASNSGTESIDSQQETLQKKEEDYVNLSVQQQTELLDILKHASQCLSTSSNQCSYPKCLLIKRLFYHASKCSIRFSGGCRHCKKVWFALMLHSRHCRQTDCIIPRCRDLKEHIKVHQSEICWSLERRRLDDLSTTST